MEYEDFLDRMLKYMNDEEKKIFLKLLRFDLILNKELDDSITVFCQSDQKHLSN